VERVRFFKRSEYDANDKRVFFVEPANKRIGATFAIEDATDRRDEIAPTVLLHLL